MFFVGFLGGNLLFFLLALLLWHVGGNPWWLVWSLAFLEALQAGWLYLLAGQLGLKVYGEARNELGAPPTGLGWLFIILGSLITVLAYYLIAHYLSERRRSVEKLPFTHQTGGNSH